MTLTQIRDELDKIDALTMDGIVIDDEDDGEKNRARVFKVDGYERLTNLRLNLDRAILRESEAKRGTSDGLRLHQYEEMDE
jgi:hypothetical protein